MKLSTLLSEKYMNEVVGKHTGTEDDVNEDELQKGIKVEMEHTNDRGIAKEIALDHLAEDPHYYTKLLKANL